MHWGRESPFRTCREPHPADARPGFPNGKTAARLGGAHVVFGVGGLRACASGVWKSVPAGECVRSASQTSLILS